MSNKPATKAMGNLTLATPTTNPPMATGSKSKKKPVADSWEDESSDEEPMSASALQSPAIVSTTSDKQGVSAPPPTPNSPANPPNAPWHGQAPGLSNMLHPLGGGYADSAAAARRPEKTDAVARRMIASALGVKAPKATEEQRAYDRAVREAEKKKKEEEREAERKRAEETARAKQAVWED
ncbi:uncharacterized protein B0I36DRAFT_363028 [Microdochium trichocladiopsis]|uniref:Uncharacterized protein n=1 Tax=Microdochium trichocladiopsis TaxID=1682393 RepID=A0A9P8Y9U3_9PEZI|nr:uncharacterized protein B0I36DRAFT_363028 [Microdochium trichocladiopsis]KAH7031320.1 hypothetical protein B0I36DRAFT_363028 [Microdochium trichocladiopsis]